MDEESTYLKNSIRKIERLSEALVFIRIYPQNQDAYRNLYEEYLKAYPYLCKNVQTTTHLASHLGPFQFLEYTNNVTLDHTLKMKYLDYKITIKGNNDVKVTSSKYQQEQEFETNYLHSLQSNNTQQFKASLEYLFDSLN